MYSVKRDYDPWRGMLVREFSELMGDGGFGEEMEGYEGEIGRWISVVTTRNHFLNNR